MAHFNANGAFGNTSRAVCSSPMEAPTVGFRNNAIASPISRLRVTYELPRIYAEVLTISVNLFFNPLGRPLLRFSIGYILVAALTFYLRFSYKARVSRLRYLFSTY